MNTPAAKLAALQQWHHIVKHRDASALQQLLADDVVFYSPVVHTPQVGKKITALYLQAALHVFNNPSFRYLREVVGQFDAVLEFETTIDGILVNGVDMLQWNDAGQITEFKVMVRPLKGIQIIHEQMGKMLQAKSAS